MKALHFIGIILFLIISMELSAQSGGTADKHPVKLKEGIGVKYQPQKKYNHNWKYHQKHTNGRDIIITTLISASLGALVGAGICRSNRKVPHSLQPKISCRDINPPKRFVAVGAVLGGLTGLCISIRKSIELNTKAYGRKNQKYKQRYFH